MARVTMWRVERPGAAHLATIRSARQPAVMMFDMSLEANLVKLGRLLRLLVRCRRRRSPVTVKKHHKMYSEIFILSLLDAYKRAAR